MIEPLEGRTLLSAAFDITQLTNLRNDPNFSNITGSGIGVAVIDTGVFAQNPDLRSNVAAFYNAVEQPVNTPIDPNFIVDAVDNVGHGSHVSGIAASSNPSIGVAYQAKLIDIKGLADPGEVQFPGDPVLRGLQWVALHASQYNIKAVNMSLGFAQTNLNFTPPLDAEGAEIQVLEGMGITVVTSSGNGYANDPTPGASIPAVESTISVANTWPSDGVGTHNFSGAFGEPGDTFYAVENSAQPDIFAATSQRSSLSNQVAAPGVDIFSTWNSPAQLHNTISGTSMSSPFVAGTVALMQQAAHLYGGFYLDPATVLQILRNSADVIVDSNDPNNGRVQNLPNGSVSPVMDLPETGLSFRRVNVYHAIQQVKQFVQSGGVGADNNNTIAKAVALAPLTGVNTDTIDGNIGTDGQIVVGNNDVDLYKVTLKATGDLLVQSSAPPDGAQFNVQLRLFDSSGAQLFAATGAMGVSYPLLRTPPGVPLPVGTYYVGVSSAGNDVYNPVTGTGAAGAATRGDYVLNITVHNPDPGGVPAAGQTINLGAPNSLLPTASLGNLPSNLLTGTIGIVINPDGSTAAFTNGDVQFYQLVAPDTGNVIVQASADVRAFDQNYNPIGVEGSNLTIPVQIGQTYYLGVTTQANQRFDPTNPYNRAVDSTVNPQPYQLAVAFDNGDRNGTVAQATPQAVGSLVQGAIGADPTGTFMGAHGGNKDVDFYAFTASSAGVFDVTVSGGSGFTPAMSLWNTSSGITGAQRLADSKTGDFHLFEQVTAGQVVLVAVTGQGNQNFNGASPGSGAGGQTGAYTLTSSLDPLSNLATLSNDSIQGHTPTPLPLNQSIPGNIGTDGDLVVGPSDVDMYSFTAPASREYTFKTDTSAEGSADTVLRVFDQFGNQIAVNDNASPATTASAVSVPMTAGQTYYIGVNGASTAAFNYNALSGAGAAPGSTGPYSIEAVDAGPFQRTLNFQSGQKAVFTDGQGHRVIVSLNGPGAGQLIFFSTSNINVGQISVSGTDSTSSISILGATSLGQVTVNGALKSFSAPNATLTADLAVTGGLGILRLASAGGGHTISIGAGGNLNASIGSLSDESLTSAEPIGALRVGQWMTSGATRYQLSAPSIGSIQLRGTFDEDISTASIGRMSVGALVGSAVRATTSIGSVFAGSAQTSEIFAGISSSLTALPTTTADFSNQTSVLKSVVIRGTFSATQIAAWNIGSASLAQIQAANGGRSFGIAADRIASLRATNNGKPQTFKNLFAPLSPINLGGDCVVRLIG